MSCLALSELPLSEQIALKLAWAEKHAAKARAVLTLFELPAETPPSPCALVPPHPAGGSNPLDAPAAAGFLPLSRPAAGASILPTAMEPVA